ncbi:phage baseplate assembly protein V [Asticcacaulis sp. AC460]|uniref:phage baseplate assembly protein V n=1 Tax=Asticcacaulis sp. AC460 TaxID=1282360 RepID=UPI000408E4DB|nr:phage baseplate assembly protein V [Asticcacaulis sp. AC460]
MSDSANETLTDLIRFGTVQSVDGARAVVKCGDVISPPLPWLAIVGAWLVWMPPSQGAQVTVICPDGDIAGGIILNGLYSDAIASPVTSLLSALLKAPDNATFVYDAAAHALTFTLPASGTVKIIAPGGFEFEGDTKVTGKLEVTDDVTLSAKLDVLGTTTIDAAVDIKSLTVAEDSVLGVGATKFVMLADMTPSTKVKAK